MSDVEPRKKSRVRRMLEAVGLVLPILAFLGYGQYTDFFSGTGGTTAPSTSASPAPAPAPAPTTSSVPSPSPAPDAADPPAASILVTPQPVPVGARYSLVGEGFGPGQNVTIRSGSFFVGFDQADGAGRIRISFPPTDQSSCATSPLTLDAVDRSEEVLASTSVRFCY